MRGKYRIPFYMSTDCENLLKCFLALNPIKRGMLEQIMKDRWINAGHEEDELKPFVEPELDIADQKRIDIMVGMGYSQEEIQQSVSKMKYDEITAMYLLLGRKSSELDQPFLQLWRIQKGARQALQIVTSKKMEFPPRNQVAVLMEERESLLPDPCLGMQVIPIRWIFLNVRKAPLSQVTVPDQRVPVASTHSISSATTLDQARYPRGTASQSTFHGLPCEQRTAT